MTCQKSLFTLLFLIFSLSVISQSFDVRLAAELNEDRTPFKDRYFKFTSASVAYINIAAPLSLLTAGIITKNNQLKKDAAFMAGGFIFSSIVTHTLKSTIKRHRPYITYSYIKKQDTGGGYSFPSGHTSAAFCTATSLSLLYPKWYVIAPCYIWAASVGCGRIYQGVHYPSDVLAGAIVGAGSAWLSYKAEKWYSKRYNKNNKPAVAFAL